MANLREYYERALREFGSTDSGKETSVMGVSSARAFSELLPGWNSVSGLHSPSVVDFEAGSHSVI